MKAILKELYQIFKKTIKIALRVAFFASLLFVATFFLEIFIPEQTEHAINFFGKLLKIT